MLSDLPTPHHTLARIHRQQRAIEIDCQLIASTRPDAPLIVFLHEGLGSISMWRDWPQRLCAELDCRGLVYSRYGYGQSTPRQQDEKRTPAYLHDEAWQDLPAVLAALDMDKERPLLYGHSDGGSIALLYAARFPERVSAIAVAAPHIFVEDITLKGIRDAQLAWEKTDLERRLGRHHRDPSSVFHSWNETWLSPEFRDWNIEDQVARITCPVLAIQGTDDEYGSLEQIHGIKRLAAQTELCILEDCGHSPHRDQPQALNQALAHFSGRISGTKPV